MDRKEFTQRLMMLGLCPVLVSKLGADQHTTGGTTDEALQQLKNDKEFIEHWLADLLDGMNTHLDRATQAKIVGECGKACFRRHPFKQEIAEKGKGDLAKLMEAYDRNFEIWREGERIHIRYGKVSKGCYCPAAKGRPAKPNDLHCECTRMTHQTIFETALGHAVSVEIAETVRRGGKTCRFIVDPG